MTTFKLNHRPVSVNVDEDTPLLWVIRDEIARRRRRNRRPSGRRAGASRRRCVMGCQPSVARRLAICERPREGHQSRHLYATAYGRRAGDGHRIPSQHRGADGPWRACNHRGRPGDRKCDIRRRRRTSAAPADPAGCGSAGSQHKELITWAARRRFKGDVSGALSPSMRCNRNGHAT